MSLKSDKDVDREVITGFSYWYTGKPDDALAPCPNVTLTLGNTIIVAGGTVSQGGGCIWESTEMGNGLTRFSLIVDGGRHLSLTPDISCQRNAWLAQAPSVFHSQGISFNDDLSQYELIMPQMTGTLSSSRKAKRRRMQCPPIYLFITPRPTTTFWSFDPTGQTSISNDLCRYLGLPFKVLSRCFWSFYGSSEGYKLLRDYQIVRGFDPTTTDFARHCGYLDPLYQPVKMEAGRFEDISEPEGKFIPCFSLRAFSADSVSGLAELAAGGLHDLGCAVARSRERPSGNVPCCAFR
ncbi:hypothetical protein AAF712_006324 [Marasmius tenuissimus]|uniref:Uncharacterized protein n=1 Tax=Marasmius tenuissimus TaxID=585030 RepID=A0ABR3A093_9AGAR